LGLENIYKQFHWLGDRQTFRSYDQADVGLKNRLVIFAKTLL